MIWAKAQTAGAVFDNDIFGDRRGFGEQQTVILDNWRRAEWMKRRQSWRRKDGDRIALVQGQLVRHAQLLTESNDSLGLRMPEMVNCQHRLSSVKNGGVAGRHRCE
jgi:hypothetical protein